MGITKGPLFFGINYKAVADITDIVKGKKLALEAYGFLHELVAGHFRSDARAASLSHHLHAGSTLDASAVDCLVANFVGEMKWFVNLAGGTDRFVVVFEGPSYPAKASVDDARRAQREKAHHSRDYRKAGAVPDCIVRIIIKELEKEGIRWIIPPAEADAQLAYLQVSPWLYLFFCSHMFSKDYSPSLVLTGRLRASSTIF